MHEPLVPRPVMVVFDDPDRGITAMTECRAGRFPFHAFVDGDAHLTVWTTTDRLDELESIIEANGGRVKP